MAAKNFVENFNGMVNEFINILRNETGVNGFNIKIEVSHYDAINKDNIKYDFSADTKDIGNIHITNFFSVEEKSDEKTITTEE